MGEEGGKGVPLGERGLVAPIFIGLDGH